MEKRVVLAVVLTIGVIFLSNLLFPAPDRPVGQVTADSAAVPGEIAATRRKFPRTGSRKNRRFPTRGRKADRTSGNRTPSSHRRRRTRSS